MSVRLSMISRVKDEVNQWRFDAPCWEEPQTTEFCRKIIVYWGRTLEKERGSTGGEELLETK